jgi:hypothetical protein
MFKRSESMERIMLKYESYDHKGLCLMVEFWDSNKNVSQTCKAVITDTTLSYTPINPSSVLPKSFEKNSKIVDALLRAYYAGFRVKSDTYYWLEKEKEENE